MNTSLPPPWVSTLPPDPRLPTMPSQEELDAILHMFDKLAEADAERRMRKLTKTTPPVRRRKS